MCEDLGLGDQDEIWFVKISEVLEVEDVPTKALKVPGEGRVVDILILRCYCRCCQ